jgi:hypothetical protein
LSGILEDSLFRHLTDALIFSAKNSFVLHSLLLLLAGNDLNSRIPMCAGALKALRKLAILDLLF